MLPCHFSLDYTVRRSRRLIVPIDLEAKQREGKRLAESARALAVEHRRVARIFSMMLLVSALVFVGWVLFR
jgi:AraC-like DNA-binding protein